VPVIHVDTEQAALIEASLQMFEAALVARVERADPEQIISNSLKLQAAKLANVRVLLQLADPPPFSKLDPTMLKKAHDLLWVLHTDPVGVQADQWWEQLRGVINTPAFPVDTPA
jgi:hypothetical protein